MHFVYDKITAYRVSKNSVPNIPKIFVLLLFPMNVWY